MKKFIIFTLYCIYMCSIFLYLLFWGPLSTLKWLQVHSYYVFTFVGILFIVAVGGAFRKYQKLKLLPAPDRKQAALELMQNKKTIKETKMILLISGLYLIFCGGVLFFVDFTGHNFILIITGLSLTYLGISVLLFWAYRRNNQWRLNQAMQAKESTALKLRSIRSQLNPHFMFNALTSIQNLMNKNDIPAANHYLALFADLTRKVLNTSDQELISLEDELKILDDYLQMEQLRFGFKYEINVGAGINVANTEIPAMLLQPFAENAVKHGVAALQDSGLIQINIKKQNNDLVLSVTDNGQGFDKAAAQNKTGSFGLKLSEERVALLNQVNPDAPVNLTIDVTQTGTVVTLQLANLLS